MEVAHAIPLKQVWLKPERGQPPVGKPLRAWFQGAWNANLEAVEQLPRMENLYGVTFGSTRMPEDSLRVLENMPRLKEVIITGPNFTDESTRYLAGLKELDSVSLTMTRVTDRGLTNIAHLKGLEFLALIGNDGITDQGLRRLSLNNIRFLNLDGTSVTGDGIASLKGATKLEWLKLSGKGAGAGLRHLQGLKNIKRLQIGGMDATEEEMNGILAQSKDLEKIETGLGNYTRKGWEAEDSLLEKLDNVRNLIKKAKQ